jgi:threonine dehydrogenase-like Zn-dependent dehydrogenase
VRPMRALVFDGKKLEIAEVPLPERGEGEALIRVIAAGICATDIEITKGYSGFTGIIGHEFVGRVKEAEDKNLIGRRVVGEINIGCGKCRYCLSSDPRHCPERSVLGIKGREGAMADYLTLPERNLHLVPDGLSDEEAVFAEPLAAALEILEEVHIRPSLRVALLGDGKLGQLIAQALALSGVELTVFGKNERKLALLRHLAVTASSDTPAGEYDIVIEATGSPKGLPLACSLVKPEGKVVVKSTFSQDKGMIDVTDLVVRELTVIGSRCGPFPPAIRLLSRGLVDVRRLITAVIPFDRAIEGFSLAGKRDSLKVIIRMEKD